MTPRNTKLGASANARRAPKGAARVASSTRPTDNSRAKGTTTSPKKPTGSGAPRKRWWMLPLILVGVLVFFVATYYPVAKVQYRETRERTRLQAELEGIKARNARLKVTVDRLKTPAGVEDYARLQLGMVKKGEHVMVVVDGTEPTQSPLAATRPVIDSEEALTPPVEPWTAFLDSVFGIQ